MTLALSAERLLKNGWTFKRKNWVIFVCCKSTSYSTSPQLAWMHTRYVCVVDCTINNDNNHGEIVRWLFSLVRRETRSREWCQQASSIDPVYQPSNDFNFLFFSDSFARVCCLFLCRFFFKRFLEEKKWKTTAREIKIQMIFDGLSRLLSQVAHMSLVTVFLIYYYSSSVDVDEA